MGICPLFQLTWVVGFAANRSLLLIAAMLFVSVFAHIPAVKNGDTNKESLFGLNAFQKLEALQNPMQKRDLNEKLIQTGYKIEA